MAIRMILATLVVVVGLTLSPPQGTVAEGPSGAS